jgi:hypothetical protein
MTLTSEQLSGLQTFPGFSRLTPMELEVAGQAFEVRHCPAGKDLYRRGEVGKYLFFLSQGQVRILQPNVLPILLSAGDLLGEETLLGHTRRATARVEEAVTAFCTTPAALNRLGQRLPKLRRTLQSIARGRRLATPARFRWLAPGEIVYVASRKAGALLVPDLLLPTLLMLASLGSAAVFLWMDLPRLWMLLSGAGLIFSVIVGIWQTINWSNDYYLVTNRRAVAIQRVPLIYDDRQETPLAMIQSVSYTSSFSQRLMRCGDVTLRTFTRPLVFPSMPQPEMAAHLIEDIWKRELGRNTPNEREEIEAVLAERLRDEAANQVTVPDGQRRESPADMGRIQTRFEIGETITYRKHLFFVLRDTFLPALLTATGICLALFAFVGVFPVDRSTGILVGAIVGCIGLAWGWYEYVDWANDHYQVTADQILAIHRKPLGDEERRSADLQNILSLEYDRPGLLARLLNFGTVTATVGQMNFTFDQVQDPVGVQEDIFRRMEKKRQRRSAAQRQERREEIATWIETYDRMTRPRPPEAGSQS